VVKALAFLPVILALHDCYQASHSGFV